ncbi:alpha/beta fold hydrolase [Streptomyces sp. NPDC005244]|uniref:alpha/beta fold hydrolase n=1 Tax=Streptomyces sp. NPDC005244 TaxID=3364708 RepID=UPI003687432E
MTEMANPSRATPPVPEFDTFASEDGLLAYRDEGPRSGRPLVLLHAGFADHTEFDNLVPRLVGHGHRVIAPDARGHGWSANAGKPFRQTDDLAALLGHLDLAAPAVLVGVSMGALIAIDTALEHPSLVRALVVSGRGLGEPDVSDPWSAARQEVQAKALAAGDLSGWLDGLIRWAAGPSRTPEDLDPELVRQLREMATRTLVKHTPDEPDRTVAVSDVPSRAKGIAVPVLAVNGALDVPACLDTVTSLMEAVPHGRTVDIEGAGHHTSLERPERFAQVLVDFLCEVYGDTGRP